MPTQDFDAIVVGAGAGGAAAACHLTHLGMAVLVIDQARLPRYKACGGAIPRSAFAHLPPPAVDAAKGQPQTAACIIRAVPTQVRFTFPHEVAVEAALPDEPAVLVMRSEFDAWLLGRAGAEVVQESAVTAVEESAAGVAVHAGERRVTARYLVAADGATSQLARCLGLRTKRRLGSALEAEVPLGGRPHLQAEYEHTALFALGIVPRGYAWVFPKSDCLSVGIGRFAPGPVRLRPALDQAMMALGIDLENLPVHGHALPCYQAPAWPLWRGRNPQEKLSTRRCLLVGDAAGLVDPLLGEGIRYAMASARLAAEAIARDSTAGYEAAVWREIGHSLATAGLAADLFYHWPRHCFRWGVRNPHSVRLFVDLLSGHSSYQGIARRLAFATARWVLSGRRTTYA